MSTHWPLVPPKVVNRKLHPFNVYIGRGSPWGNPYVIGMHGDRAECIARYEVWLRERIAAEPERYAELFRYLTGKILGCFCSPKPCHGDVIVKIWWEMVGRSDD